MAVIQNKWQTKAKARDKAKINPPATHAPVIVNSHMSRTLRGVRK